MKIDTLIRRLQRVRKARGNVNVTVNAFGEHIGANYHHGAFVLNSLKPNFNVANHMNALGEFPLTIRLDKAGIESLKRQGYNVETFYERVIVKNPHSLLDK